MKQFERAITALVILSLFAFSTYASQSPEDSIKYGPYEADKAGCLDCFNFVAPTVVDAESMSPAEIGLIVFDSNQNSFRGVGSGGKWRHLSPSVDVNAGSLSVTLNSASPQIHVFDPTTSEITITLDASFAKTQTIKVFNRGTKKIKVQSSTGTDDIAPVYPGATVEFLSLVDSPSSGTNWEVLGTMVSAWQDYTPTFTGFGAVSSSTFRWRRLGDNIEVEGTFTSGAVSAVEARVSLPENVSTPSSLTTLEAAGTWLRDSPNTPDKGGFIFKEASTSYMTFSLPLVFGVGTISPLNKQNADALVAAGHIITLKASFPVSGWSLNRGI